MLDDKIDISAVIITLNDAERVTKLAESLLLKVNDVVVFIDDRSDESVDAALSEVPGCRFQRYHFEGFGKAKREAVAFAKFDWIFSLDADELPDDECFASIANLDLSTPGIFSMKRLNHYAGRPIKACGWYPDFVTRVFHREVANFSEDKVHESVKPLNDSVSLSKLEGQILHYSFSGSHELLGKLLNYSCLYAENYQGKAKPVILILLRSVFSFIKFYFFKKGVFYGRDGFIISLMNAGGVFHKHWRAAEIVKQRNSN